MKLAWNAVQHFRAYWKIHRTLLGLLDPGRLSLSTLSTWPLSWKSVTVTHNPWLEFHGTVRRNMPANLISIPWSWANTRIEEMPLNHDSWKAVRMEFSPYSYYRTDFQLFLWVIPRPGCLVPNIYCLIQKPLSMYDCFEVSANTICKYYKARNIIKITYLNTEYQILVLFQIGWVEKN